MGFYLSQGGKSSYISEYYLKYSLLHTDKLSNEVASIKNDSEETILKKLNIEIPEIRIEDIIKQFQSHLETSNIDDYSAILSFNRSHLLAIFYLLHENKITDKEFKKLLFSSSFKTRNDLILSYLYANEEESIDLFKPLQSYLYKLYNYDNPRELKALKKTIKILKNELGNEQIAFTLQKLNIGNFFYAVKKGGSETLELFKYCNSSNKWDLSGCTLPDDSDAIGILHGGTYSIDYISSLRKIDWWRTFGYIALVYVAIAALLALLAVFSCGLSVVLGAVMGALAPGIIAEFDNARAAFGMSDYLFNNGIFTKYLADTKYIRLDRVETDLISKHLFKAATDDFSNRLNINSNKYEPESISDDVSHAYANNWHWELDPDNPNVRESLLGLKNRKTCKIDNFDWYNELYQLISGDTEHVFTDDSPNDNPEEYTLNKSTFIGTHFSDINDETPTSFTIKDSDRATLLGPIGLGCLINSSDKERVLNNDYFISTMITSIELDNFFAMILSIFFSSFTNPFYSVKNAPKNIDFLLSNDILIGDLEDINFGKDSNDQDIIERGARIINFGTVGIRPVIEKIVEKVKEENANYVLGIHEFADVLNENKRVKAFDHMVSFIENDANLQDVKSSLSESQQNLFPLARSIVYRYILWLNNDSLDEKTIDYVAVVSPWYFKYYQVSYYFRHSYLNLVNVRTQIKRDVRYQRLFNDPCGDRAALNALYLFCQKYQNSLPIKLFAPALGSSLGTISSMMTNIYKPF